MAPFFLGHGVDALDFVVDGFFMKLLHTSNVDTVKEYRIFFRFDMRSNLLKRRAKNKSETVSEPAEYYVPN